MNATQDTRGGLITGRPGGGCASNAWCTGKHRYICATVVHEGMPSMWLVADGAARIEQRMRRYDDDDTLLVLTFMVEGEVYPEVEMTMSDVVRTVTELSSIPVPRMSTDG